MKFFVCRENWSACHEPDREVLESPPLPALSPAGSRGEGSAVETIENRLVLVVSLPATRAPDSNVRKYYCHVVGQCSRGIPHQLDQPQHCNIGRGHAASLHDSFGGGVFQ